MADLLYFVIGLLAGGIGALIYYRRHVNEVEAKLKAAVVLRKLLEEQVRNFKAKIGG